VYKINLLPTELQKDLSIDVKGLVRRVTITVIVILLLFGYGAFLFVGYLTQREISDTEKYLSQISSAVKRVEEIKAQRVKDEKSTKIYQELLSARQVRFPLLEDISHNLPVDMWLEKLNMSYVAPKEDGKNSQPAQAANDGAQEQQNTQSHTQGQADDKNKPSSPPVPNTLIVEGYSRTVPSIGIFMNNLYRMPYFSNVVLNELATDEKSGNIKFKLTAALKDGDNNVAEVAAP